MVPLRRGTDFCVIAHSVHLLACVSCFVRACEIAAAGTRVVVVKVGSVHAVAAMRGELPETCTIVELANGES